MSTIVMAPPRRGTCRSCGGEVLFTTVDRVKVTLEPEPNPLGQVALSGDGYRGVSMLRDEWVGVEPTPEVQARRYRVHQAVYALRLDGTCLGSATLRSWDGAMRDLLDYLDDED
jgi:hypothetical protein